MAKYLTIILTLGVLILGCTTFFYKNKANTYKDKYDAVRANNELLEGKIKKVYDDKLETDKRNAELEATAKEDKSGFDWNADISSSPIVVQLRKD